MSTFSLTPQDILVMSVSINVCILLNVLTNTTLTWLPSALAKHSTMVQTLMDLQRSRPGVLGTFFMEQITLWTLITLTLVTLTYTSVSVSPFSHQPLPFPAFFIRLILGANVARFLVLASRILLVRDQSGSSSSSHLTFIGQSGHLVLDFVYHISSAVALIFWLGYHENLLLAVTTPFMEISSTPTECCRLIELAQKRDSRSYRKTAILSCAICALCRIALPLLLLILASYRESPFTLSSVPLGAFMLSGALYAVYNSLLFWQSISRIRKFHSQKDVDLFRLSSALPFANSVQVLQNDAPESGSGSRSGQYQLQDSRCDLFHSFGSSSSYCWLIGHVGQKEDQTNKAFVENATEYGSRRTSKDRTFFRRFSLKRCRGRELEKAGSRDLLLDSHEHLSEKEVGSNGGCLNEYVEQLVSYVGTTQSKYSTAISRITSLDDAVQDKPQTRTNQDRQGGSVGIAVPETGHHVDEGSIGCLPQGKTHHLGSKSLGVTAPVSGPIIVETA